jgi:hypothetical protein
MNSVWSKAEIDLARRLWNEEGKTAEEIASAIGRLAEMIAGTGADVSRDGNGHAVRAKPLVDLNHHECRFPVAGDQPAEMLFCAAAVHPDEWRPGRVGGSYCRHHRALSGGGWSQPDAVAGLQRRIG